MWLVPNQFKCKIKDEDKRLKLISENLITTSSKEYQPATYHPVSGWFKKWVSFINVAHPLINEHLKSIKKGALVFDHLKPQIEMDLYEDLPFLSESTLKGKYIYISMDGWDQETKLETIKYPNIKKWPTPLASDWHFYRLNKPLSKTAWGGVESRNVNSLAVCVHWDAKLYKTHQANPRWVEQMMGLPIGWTGPYL